MAEEVALRPMTDADLPAALDMWVESWRAAYPSIDFEARRPWMHDRIGKLAREGSQCVVAADGAAIVGLLLVNPATFYLDQIAVARGRLGSGLAGALLAEARRLSPQRLDLHVNMDNARAIAFYKKHGFAVTGESTNPRSGAPIYLMRWQR